MRFLLLTTITLLLAACTTPKTVLRHPETKQVVHCGGSVTGSLAGGVIGYHIQKSNDTDCVEGYREQGFEKVDKTEGSF